MPDGFTSRLLCGSMAEAQIASAANTFMKNIFFAVIIAILYYYYQQKFETDEKKRIENVLSGLLKEEKNANASTSLPIAVGFGSCLDLFVDGIALMNALNITPPKVPKYHEKIETLEQVADMFALYLSEGAAAERYIPKALLEKLINAGEDLRKHRWAAGGNAPVISKRFSTEGFTSVFVGAQSSERFNSLYPNKLEFTHKTSEDDDVHLILEFKVGEVWGTYHVNRANRFIVHSDNLNPYLKSLESFFEKVEDIKPRLLVTGAFQMLDNFPFPNGVREQRMKKLKEFLIKVPSKTLIHFEMASFSEKAMLRSLIENVMIHADSLGMNEQELPNIVSMIKHDKIIEVADSNPRTAVVLDQMREIYNYFKENSERGLSRIHLHTLSFQAMLIRNNSPWRNTKAGAAKASLVAHRYVCGEDDIQVDKSRLIMDDSFKLSLNESSGRVYFNESSPISCWNEDDYEICIAPVLVCTQVKQTAGGGDNITPAGLMLQI